MEFELLDAPVQGELVRIIGSGLEPSDIDEEEKLEASDQSQVEVSIPLSDRYQRAAGYIADFQATRQDIIRAVPCYEALRGFGRAFRYHKPTDYQRSFPTDKIQEFWSHSWHGSTPRKISTVIVQKNGLAAISAGTLASLLLVCLFVGGYLPGYERAPFQQTGRDSYLFGIWGMVGGTFVTIVTLICWQCRTPVFVDVMCIHQSDPGLKAEALLSMGALLQSSESLHVWWDETFVERLWCVFEVGAFLGSCTVSDSRSAKTLIIRPTMLGTSSIATFCSLFVAILSFMVIPFDNLLLGWVIFSVLFLSLGHFAARSLRSYFAAVESMLVQLRNFRIRDAKCQCCTVGHPEDDSNPYCDREIINLCIRKWFGTESAFEKLVATDVSAALARALGDSSFSYRWLLMVSAPFYWGYMDQVAARLRAGDMRDAAVTAIVTLTFSFLAFPFIGRLGIILACKARRQRQQLWANELVTFAVFAAGFPVAGAILTMQSLLLRVMDPLAGASMFAAINLILLLTLLRQCSRMSLLSQDAQ
ncbi:unnamed protein product [Symbiodinium microadriaticum]|nr:unnamed protein product [Symbiodinium microadriaticum]CAE7442380.1 unnamed protein product [Symbiodinium sp. KB8]